MLSFVVARYFVESHDLRELPNVQPVTAPQNAPNAPAWDRSEEAELCLNFGDKGRAEAVFEAFQQPQ